MIPPCFLGALCDGRKLSPNVGVETLSRDVVKHSTAKY